MDQIASSQIKFLYLQLYVYELNSVKGETKNESPKADPWPDNIWWIELIVSLFVP